MVSEHAIRVPGRVMEQFVALAVTHLENGLDKDICEALSRAQVRPKGRGFTAVVPIPREDVGRLAAWISDDTPRFMRDYRARMHIYAEVQREAGRLAR